MKIIKIMIKIVDAEGGTEDTKATKAAILSQVVKLTEAAFTSNLSGQELAFDKTVYSETQVCAEVYLQPAATEQSEE